MSLINCVSPGGTFHTFNSGTEGALTYFSAKPPSPALPVVRGYLARLAEGDYDQDEYEKWGVFVDGLLYPSAFIRFLRAQDSICAVANPGSLLTMILREAPKHRIKTAKVSDGLKAAWKDDETRRAFVTGHQRYWDDLPSDGIWQRTQHIREQVGRLSAKERLARTLPMRDTRRLNTLDPAGELRQAIVQQLKRIKKNCLKTQTLDSYDLNPESILEFIEFQPKNAKDMALFSRFIVREAQRFGFTVDKLIDELFPRPQPKIDDPLDCIQTDIKELDHFDPLYLNRRQIISWLISTKKDIESGVIEELKRLKDFALDPQQILREVNMPSLDEKINRLYCRYIIRQAETLGYNVEGLMAQYLEPPKAPVTLAFA